METPLTIRDILPYSPASDYNPLVPAKPCNFNKDSTPLPLHKDFSPEEFRSFWKEEREAFQWIYSSEKVSRTFYKANTPLDTHLPVATTTPISNNVANRKGGRPPVFDWTIKHVCRHSGRQKTLAIARSSVHQACPAYIRIRRLRNGGDIHIEYHWEHSHATDMQFRSKFPQGPNELHWMKAMVQDGKRWRDLRKQLTPFESESEE
ncbi:hypothetical protein BGZ99_007204, partial [Dissophora globulifera]